MRLVVFLFVIAALIGLLSPFDFSSDISLANPFILPAIIGAGASLVGGALSSFGQSSTNQLNYKINKENRQWQTKENEKARTWEEKMWNESNAYNTPQATMERYQQAGLNPYLSQGQVGQGATTPSAPSMTGAPSTPVMGNTMAGFAGIGESLGSMLINGELASSTVALNKAKELNEVMDGLSKIWTDLSPAQRDVAWKKLYSRYGDFSDINGRSSRLDNMLSDSYLKSMEGALQEQNANLQQELNKNGQSTRILWQYDQQFAEIQARIGKMASDASVNEVNKSLMNQQMKELKASITNLLSQAREHNASAATIEGLKQYVVDKAKYAALSAGLSYDELESSYQENERVRDYRRSDTGKGRSLDRYTYSNHVWRDFVHDVEDAAQSVPVRGYVSSSNIRSSVYR